MNKLTVTILAAGLGTRLGELTKTRPKSLIPVCGIPVIRRALSWARLLNPSKIIVVGGYLFPQLKEAVRAIDTDVLVIENKKFETTQRMVSLLSARDEICGDLLEFDGDFIFHRLVAERIRPHLRNRMKIFCTDKKYPALDMKIKADASGFLVDMSKNLKKWDYFYTTPFFCPREKVGAFFKSAERTIAEKSADSPSLEDALVAYAHGGGTVEVVPIEAPSWIEIDRPQDIRDAEEVMKGDPEGFRY